MFSSRLVCLTVFCAVVLSCGDKNEVHGPSTAAVGEVEVQSPSGVRYFMDRTEVTRRAYAAWLATNPSTAGQPAPCLSNNDFTPTCSWPPGDKGEHPVVCVDWCDAYAYCRAVGKRLCGLIGGGMNDYHTYDDPDKDQWFNACSAGETNAYPYGATYDGHICNGGLHGLGETAPVGSFPECATANGILDLSGNATEWKDACETDPTNEVAFNYCRVGGGAFRSGELRHQTCESPGADAARMGHWDSIGFRCCRDDNTAAPPSDDTTPAGSNGCNDCLGSSCSTQDDACLNSEDCIHIVDCAMRCFSSSCVTDCENEYPAGADAHRALWDCFDDSCAAACE